MSGITLSTIGGILSIVTALIVILTFVGGRAKWIKWPWDGAISALKDFMKVQMETSEKTLHSALVITEKATTTALTLTEKAVATRMDDFEKRIETRMSDTNEKMQAGIAENTKKHVEAEKRLDKLEFNHAHILKEIDEVRAMIKDEAAQGRSQLDKIDNKMEIIRQMIERRSKD